MRKFSENISLAINFSFLSFALFFREIFALFLLRNFCIIFSRNVRILSRNKLKRNILNKLLKNDGNIKFNDLKGVRGTSQ